MYGISSVGFCLHDRLQRVQFFEETFLLTKISMEAVVGISFFALCNANVKFYTRKVTCRKYTVVKAMPITRQVKLIYKHKFPESTFDKALEMFVLYMATLEIPMSIMTVY